MIKNTLNIVITFLAIFLLSTTYAQEIEVKVDRDSILIGEMIKLSIQYPLDNATSSLQFFEGDSIGNGFEVFTVFSKDTLEGKIAHKLGISTFELDNLFVPPFTVFYGESKLVSRPIPVFISLMEVDTNQPIKDIKPIMEDALTSSDYMKMAWNWAKSNWWIIVLALLLVGLILWLIFRKKELKPEKEIVEPTIPAHILATKELKKLEEKQLWQNDQQKEYNVELTRIIERYIAQRYNVTTAEKTSSEILHSLRFIEIGEANKQNLKKLLTLSDLVKFAKEKPTKEDNESVMRDAYTFIKTTKNKETN